MFTLNSMEFHMKELARRRLRREADHLPDLCDAIEGEYSKEPVILVTCGLEWEERQDIVDQRLCEVLPGGRTTYRLTPQHFAWLHSRMSNAQAAHKPGQLDAERWEEMRRRFNRLQERAVSLFGEGNLRHALQEFNPRIYRLPEASAQEVPHPAQAASSSASLTSRQTRLPASCPHTEEKLIEKARNFPHLAVCPAADPPWWWVTKSKCATNCPGHPDCIRNLYWTGSGVPTIPLLDDATRKKKPQGLAPREPEKAQSAAIQTDPALLADAMISAESVDFGGDSCADSTGGE